MKVKQVQQTTVEEDGEELTQSLVTLTGKLSELINASMNQFYGEPGANPNETDTVKVSGSVGNMFREHGLSGPGKSDPDFEILLSLEGEAELEGEGTPWDELTEISGIGEKKKEKIKEKLLGEDNGS